MNVLSLFDGISCAQTALIKSGFVISKYFASEIDTAAISLTCKNYPATIQLGDIKNINPSKLPKIDLLIGGSPCQGFSINGDRLNFEDERSKLLFKFIEIRDLLSPKYWLLENVATMDAVIKSKIDEYTGVKGRYINSNSFSAQNRKRIYWTNIDFEEPFTISQSSVKDILESDVDSKRYWSEQKISQQLINPTVTDGVITINPKRHNNKQTYQQDRIYGCNGKIPALTATLGDRFNIKDAEGRIRRLTVREQARLQTIPDSFDFSGVSTLNASKCIGNGFTVEAISHILKNMVYETL